MTRARSLRNSSCIVGTQPHSPPHRITQCSFNVYESAWGKSNARRSWPVTSAAVTIRPLDIFKLQAPEAVKEIRAAHILPDFIVRSISFPALILTNLASANQVHGLRKCLPVISWQAQAHENGLQR